MRRAIIPALVSAFVALSGCKASVEGNVNTGKSGDEVADFDKPMDPNASAETRAADEAPSQTSLLGARLDLAFKGSPAATCNCLAVAVGQPGDGSFQWAATRPRIDKDSQVVVALSSAGVPCNASDGTSASYWGYEVVGPDVVVVVESSKPGVPLVQGALVPRPIGGGLIYVRPVDKTVPFGRPQSGTGDRCQVANLGAPASPSGAAPLPSAQPSRHKTIKTDEADPSSTRVEIP